MDIKIVEKNIYNLKIDLYELIKEKNFNLQEKKVQELNEVLDKLIYKYYAILNLHD